MSEREKILRISNGSRSRYRKATCDVTQLSSTVTRSSRSRRDFCSTPRITTWLTATSLSSRSGHCACVRLKSRGQRTSPIRMIFLDVDELTSLSNRSAPSTRIMQWFRSILISLTANVYTVTHSVNNVEILPCVTDNGCQHCRSSSWPVYSLLSVLSF